MEVKCFAFLLISVSLVATREITLSTSLGNVTGIEEKIDNAHVTSFLGIPYGKPPVADLRFAKPKPYGSFKSKLNATVFGPRCMQIENGKTVGQENCLFLNIFSPSSSMNKSVMMWIHGGSFSIGQSNDYIGSILATFGQVIVVTINYRLNVFGFLTTGDKRLPGNYGLWDQQLAIQWVKDNIADYGGNPSSITLFGESAGGRSVSFQMFSPHNDRSLFQRAITESGSALSLTFINRDSMPITRHIAGRVNCQISAVDFVGCLRSVSAEDLLNATAGIDRPFPFFPSVDGDFLRYDLGHVFANFSSYGANDNINDKIANFASYDLFSGWNNQDGLIYMAQLQGENEKVTGANLSKGVGADVLRETVKLYPFYNYPKNDDLKTFVVDFLINYYMKQMPQGNLSVENQRVKVYPTLAGDVVLRLPTIQHLQLHAAMENDSSTFAYEFTHKRNSIGRWYEGPDWLRAGADHTDEIPYVFGAPLIPGTNFNQEEKILSKKMMKIWADFAKTGLPGNDFKPFTHPNGQSYTSLDTASFEMKSYPLNDVLKIWSTLDSTLIADDEPRK